jgi:hypothetical protein
MYESPPSSPIASRAAMVSTPSHRPIRTLPPAPPWTDSVRGSPSLANDRCYLHTCTRLNF